MAINKDQTYLHTGRFAIISSNEVKVTFAASITITTALQQLLEQAGFFECTDHDKTNLANVGPVNFSCFHLEEQRERTDRILKRLSTRLPDYAPQINKVKDFLSKYHNNWVLVPTTIKTGRN